MPTPVASPTESLMACPTPLPPSPFLAEITPKTKFSLYAALRAIGLGSRSR